MQGRGSPSRPVVTVEAFIMLQATVDLPRFPATLVKEDVGEFVEIALVEFDTTVSAVGDVGLTPEVGVDLTGGRVVAVDC